MGQAWLRGILKTLAVALAAAMGLSGDFVSNLNLTSKQTLILISVAAFVIVSLFIASDALETAAGRRAQRQLAEARDNLLELEDELSKRERHLRELGEHLLTQSQSLRELRERLYTYSELPRLVAELKNVADTLHADHLFSTSLRREIEATDDLVNRITLPAESRPLVSSEVRHASYGQQGNFRATELLRGFGCLPTLLIGLLLYAPWPLSFNLPFISAGAAIISYSVIFMFRNRFSTLAPRWVRIVILVYIGLFLALPIITIPLRNG